MMSSNEKENLLTQGAHEFTSSPTYSSNRPPSRHDDETTLEGIDTGLAGGGGGGGSPSKTGGVAAEKHDRLQRKAPLTKVEEADEKKSHHGCPLSFGVRSYLHHFYEKHQFKDPTVYEDEDDLRYLLHPNLKRRRCTSVWWKVFVWIGANFLVFGVIGVLVGYLVPQRPIIIGAIADNIEVIDREAISFNFNLDVCKLVGLILFCIGGMTLTTALLFPSVLHSYCDEERRDVAAFQVRSCEDEKPPLSPTDKIVPASATISEVQPERNGSESRFTQEGMVALTE